MMTYNRSEIMRWAWEIRKARGCTMSDALKASWQTAKEEKAMEQIVKELVEKYHIEEAGPAHPGMIRLVGVKRDVANAAKPEIMAHKKEILAYLAAQRKEREERMAREAEARKRAAEEWEARINAAIPGIVEVRNLRDAWRKWKAAFDRSFEYGDCGGMVRGVRKPAVTMDEMYARYPIAAAYLEAERLADDARSEIQTDGKHREPYKEAMEQMIEDPSHYAEAMAAAKAEIEAYRRAESLRWWD